MARSRARSLVVMMKAPPPSEITQQSSLCNGSAIMRELRTSSTVIGSRYCASGLRPANSRTPTAISASCSDVVPYSCMWRRAAMAYPPASTLPHELSYGGRSLDTRGTAGERARPEHAPHAGQHVRPVGHEDDIAQSGLDGRGRVLDVELEGGAADRRPVDPTVIDAQVLGHVRGVVDIRIEPGAGTHVAVDVRLLQSAVGQRSPQAPSHDGPWRRARGRPDSHSSRCQR